MLNMHLNVFAIAAMLASSVVGHGYLVYPPPRGIQKETYQIDDLKSPNRKGLCRGEPVGKITPVSPGGSVTLKFKITAPHVGPCVVYVLDENLQNSQKIASKMNCAAPGEGKPWTIQLPNGLSGHKVLRWTWEGQHVSPSEPYEQCIDISIGGSGGDSKDATPPVDYEAEKSGKRKGPMSDRRPKQADKRPKQAENDDSVDNNGGADNSDNEQPKYDDDEHSSDDLPVVKKYNTAQPEQDAPQQTQGAADAGFDTDAGDDAGAEESCPTNGAFVCKNAKFAQCANGKWILFACPPGTVCQASSSGNVACLPSQA